MENLFFELIRVAVGRQECLSREPSAAEWAALYAMAEQQTLLGVCFAGLRLLQDQRKDLPMKLYFQWLAAASQIQQRNEVLNKQCKELGSRLNASGIRWCILKGQGIAQYYGDLGALRQSGDIDIFVDCGRVRAIAWAREQGQQHVEWDKKHLHLNIYPRTEVEMHYQVENLMTPWRNRRWHKWCREHENDIFTKNGCLVTPDTSFNLVYILLHAFRHVVTGGVGLRQVMDYYFLLISNEKTVMNNDDHLLSQFGLYKFATAVMWVMGSVFGLEHERMICEPDEKEGRLLLKEIMLGGNFGHFDKRYHISLSSHMGYLWNVMKKNVNVLAHYPSEVLWTPWWFVRHFFWKRWVMLIGK